VPGLYAAGNAAASPFGTATAAGGATLGPALVFGFRAGQAAAGDL
jgi:succinate dehydrogenase/fumarate reductase flavoprotein subunit